MASARMGVARPMSIWATMLECATPPPRQIRVSAPGKWPAATWASRKRGMRANLSFENPGGIIILPVILRPAMNDRSKNWPALSLEEAHARLTAPGAAFETAEITVRGVPLRVWKHVPATAAEAFARARAYGSREFLVYQ